MPTLKTKRNGIIQSNVKSKKQPEVFLVNCCDACVLSCIPEYLEQIAAHQEPDNNVFKANGKEMASHLAPNVGCLQTPDVNALLLISSLIAAGSSREDGAAAAGLVSRNDTVQVRYLGCYLILFTLSKLDLTATLLQHPL